MGKRLLQLTGHDLILALFVVGVFSLLALMAIFVFPLPGDHSDIKSLLGVLVGALIPILHAYFKIKPPV